jgi:hypothetical protein
MNVVIDASVILNWLLDEPKRESRTPGATSLIIDT